MTRQCAPWCALNAIVHNDAISYNDRCMNKSELAMNAQRRAMMHDDAYMQFLNVHIFLLFSHRARIAVSHMHTTLTASWHVHKFVPFLSVLACNNAPFPALITILFCVSHGAFLCALQCAKYGANTFQMEQSWGGCIDPDLWPHDQQYWGCTGAHSYHVGTGEPMVAQRPTATDCVSNHNQQTLWLQLSTDITAHTFVPSF